MRWVDLLPAALRAQWISPAEVRAEKWALGVRHHGQIRDGVRTELAAADVPVRRRVLLNAVVRSLTD